MNMEIIMAIAMWTLYGKGQDWGQPMWVNHSPFLGATCFTPWAHTHTQTHTHKQRTYTSKATYTNTHIHKADLKWPGQIKVVPLVKVALVPRYLIWRGQYLYLHICICISRLLFLSLFLGRVKSSKWPLLPCGKVKIRLKTKSVRNWGKLFQPGLNRIFLGGPSTLP